MKEKKDNFCMLQNVCKNSSSVYDICILSAVDAYYKPITLYTCTAVAHDW